MQFQSNKINNEKKRYVEEFFKGRSPFTNMEAVYKLAETKRWRNHLYRSALGTHSHRCYIQRVTLPSADAQTYAKLDEML